MKEIHLPIIIAESIHDSEHTVSIPLQIPKLIALNMDNQQFAYRIGVAIQEDLLKKGVYEQLLHYLISVDLHQGEILFHLDASKQFIFPDLKLRFQWIYWKKEEGTWLGFVPSLRIESSAQDFETLQSHIQQNIQLEFLRKKRNISVKSILATQWFKQLNLYSLPHYFRFYTLSEQDKFRDVGKREILPEVSQRMMEAYTTALFGLEKELEKLSTALKGQLRTSVLIVGDTGKGKTALVREFHRLRYQYQLGNTSIWETSASQLIFRLTSLGSWQEFLALVCNELRKLGDILYVSNFAELFEVGQYVGNSISIGDFLRDYIARGDITLLSECTPEELALIELRSPGFSGLFTVIKIEEMSSSQIRQIALQKIQQIAQEKDCIVEEAAVIEILRLQQWFTPYSGLPGKTIRFLEAMITETQNQDERKITKADIFAKFSQETGMPEFMVNPHIVLNVEEMSRFFYQNIYGQEEAVRTVLDVIITIKAAIIRRGKPLASLFFVGPTGVGKTEMAKILAEFMFGNRNKMIRFDMSEYADPYAILRLIGDRNRGEGLLTAAVRQEPFSVILFDEIEKVYPSFYDLLLQILGEGRLTDAFGRVADFCSTIIIMTSNIGSRSFQMGKIGFTETNDTQASAIEHFIAEVQAYFRPELVNRLDRIITFSPLPKSVVRQIVDREIDLIKKREGIKGRKLEIDIQKEVLDYLGEIGYNSGYGARFLQRAIQEKLLLPLAEHLNAYHFRTVLQIAITLINQKIHFHIAIESDFSLGEQKIGSEKQGTVLDYINQVTQWRRDAQKIEKGNYYAKFLSKIDQIKRELLRIKQKNEAQYWKHESLRKEMYELENLQKQFQEHFSEIQTLEGDNFLFLNGIEENMEMLHQQSLRWATSFNRLKRKLVAIENPEFETCTLGVYGMEEGLRRSVVAMYQNIIAKIGLKVTIWNVWLNENKYEKTPPNHEKLIPPAYQMVGQELEINGELAYIWFNEEKDVHLWTDAYATKHKFFLSILPVAQAKFETPQNVYRKNFFDKKEVKRQYLPNQVKDVSFVISKSYPFFVDDLWKVLSDKFDKKIDRYLLG